MCVVCIEEASPQCLYFIWFYLCYFFLSSHVFLLLFSLNSVCLYDYDSQIQFNFEKKSIKILWTILIHLFLFNLLFLDEKNNEITKSSSFSCLSDNSIDVGVWRRIFVYIYFSCIAHKKCERARERERQYVRVSHTCVRALRVFVCECSFYSSMSIHVYVCVFVCLCHTVWLYLGLSLRMHALMRVRVSVSVSVYACMCDFLLLAMQIAVKYNHFHTVVGITIFGLSEWT